VVSDAALSFLPHATTDTNSNAAARALMHVIDRSKRLLRQAGEMVSCNCATGQSLVLVNDHDPKPLRYQLMAEHPDTFDWTYEAEGPEVWRVRIRRR
jgi:uncharacterized protein (DUF2249 family)